MSSVEACLESDLRRTSYLSQPVFLDESHRSTRPARELTSWRASRFNAVSPQSKVSPSCRLPIGASCQAAMFISALAATSQRPAAWRSAWAGSPTRPKRAGCLARRVQDVPLPGSLPSLGSSQRTCSNGTRWRATIPAPHRPTPAQGVPLADSRIRPLSLLSSETS